MLKFDGAWRLDSPGEIAPGVADGFFDLINKVASQFENRYHVLEHFKRYFARAGDDTYYRSSDLRFAEYDLQTRYMGSASGNAARFIEAFYDACQDLLREHPEITVPDAAQINKVLYENGAGYEVAPPNLICRNRQPPVPVPPPPPASSRGV
jgi:hypothetical protein